MATCTKTELGSSTDGRLIMITATATPGTTIHTTPAIVGTDNYDEIWLWGVNSTTISVKLTIEWGSTSAPLDNIELTMSPENGLITLVPGLILQNGLIVSAFAGTASTINIGGFVNQIRA